jgi:hypothetical protein
MGVDAAAPAWFLQDRAGFAEAWGAHAAAVSSKGIGPGGEAGGVALFEQQRFVREYLGPGSPYRGLLLYHGLGSGKTCAAVATCEALRAGEGKRVVVMLPASLRPNYARDVKRCGGRMFSEQQRWRRGAADGVTWVTDAVKGVAFDALPAAGRAEVRRQLDAAISAAHRFVSYNGLTRTAAAALCSSSFDDTVVVIDEVHNFVSAVANDKLLACVYHALLDARRCKVLLLSGTPLVNSPRELAYIANLVHGYVEVHEHVLAAPLDAAGEAALSACPVVLEHSQDVRREGEPVVDVRLAPEGFVRGRRPGTLVAAPPASGSGTGAEAARAALLAAGATVLGVHVRRTLLLPTDAAEFEAAFVDAAGNRLRNVEVLRRRLQGTVSFFPGHDPAMYPRVTQPALVRAPLSGRQFIEYVQQRQVERRKELQAAAFAARRRGGRPGGEEAGTQQVYRFYSRAICNFAFPEDVPRPYLASLRGADNGDDDDASTPEGREASAKRAYEAALSGAIEQLRAQPGRLSLLQGSGGLEELSPKFAAIVRHVSRGGPLAALSGGAGGTAIIYTQFRRAEGVRLLAAALDANGFSELRLERDPSTKVLRLHLHPSPPGTGQKRRDAAKKNKEPGKGAAVMRYIVYNNEDKEAAQVLLQIFNNELSEVPESVLEGLAELSGGRGGKKTPPSNERGALARLLLVTKSGAEGINTKNVREVHVVEPFWHANRVQQAIGRAVRAGSHAALPHADRTVAAYVYVATLSDEQRADRNSTVNRLDGGRTSDEYVQDVALRKRALLEQALDTMRRAAVDCRRPFAAAGKCFSAPAGAAPDAPLYRAADLRRDLADAARSSLRGELVPVTVGGEALLADPETGQLYRKPPGGGRPLPTGGVVRVEQLRRSQTHDSG